MPTFEFDEDYERAADESYYRSVMLEHENENKMLAALGDSELTFTGDANANRFYAQWLLVEAVLAELDGKEMVHLTINAKHTTPPDYNWRSPNVWEATITHMGGCYTKTFRT